MKKFCVHCGDKLFYRNKYCSDKCANRYDHSKPRTIQNYFPLFRNIAAESADLDEFKQLYRRYFDDNLFPD